MYITMNNQDFVKMKLVWTFWSRVGNGSVSAVQATNYRKQEVVQLSDFRGFNPHYRPPYIWPATISLLKWMA